MKPRVRYSYRIFAFNESHHTDDEYKKADYLLGGWRVSKTKVMALNKAWRLANKLNFPMEVQRVLSPSELKRRGNKTDAWVVYPEALKGV